MDVENLYYTAKGMVDDDLDAALDMFTKVIDNEPEPGKWSFKARKQQFKLAFKAGRYQAAIERYTQLLAIAATAVSRNDAEKSINNMLDLVSGTSVAATRARATPAGPADLAILEQIYSSTLAALEQMRNDRLVLRANLKLAKLYLDRDEYPRLARVIRAMHAAVERGAGGSATDGGGSSSGGGADEAARRGTQMLEIYALEIQMYSRTKESQKLKELYHQCLAIKSAIPSPRIMGIIRECGGKMYMSEENWSEANSAFFESFKNYDDAGSPQRIAVLKYLVLANMLSQSQINPFDSQEAKSYKSDPEIVAMTDLVAAYQHRDIKAFEKILKKNKSAIMEDPFIREYIDEVLRSIRMAVIVTLVQPYTRLTIQYLADHLNITADQVEPLLVTLILDERIDAKIDQASGTLELFHAAPSTASGGAAAMLAQQEDAVAIPKSLYAVVEEWATQLEAVNGVVVGKLSAHLVH
ncbi:putative COP9 signalosome complex subunit 2 [Blastocladiella britannica]|nr:putative COP9 signalosome complex subunit 2 [Blastocladiella britannica]